MGLGFYSIYRLSPGIYRSSLHGLANLFSVFFLCNQHEDMGVLRTDSQSSNASERLKKKKKVNPIKFCGCLPSFEDFRTKVRRVILWTASHKSKHWQNYSGIHFWLYSPFNWTADFTALQKYMSYSYIKSILTAQNSTQAV